MTYYGQFQTDKHIEKYFASHLSPSNKNQGQCIEIDAVDGIDGSNTYLFEKKGWKCLCIEPNPIYFEKLKTNRQYVMQAACGAEDKDDVKFEIFHLNDNNMSAISSLKADDRLISSHSHLIKSKSVIRVNLRTLNHILEDPKYSKLFDKIDFVSIDTENTELDVLRGFDINKYRPTLLVIENNFNDLEISNYLKPFNYLKVERVGVNDFYLRILT